MDKLRVGMKFKSIFKHYRSYSSIVEIIEIDDYRVSIKVIKKSKFCSKNIREGEIIKIHKRSIIEDKKYIPIKNKIRKL